MTEQMSLFGEHIGEDAKCPRCGDPVETGGLCVECRVDDGKDLVTGEQKMQDDSILHNLGESMTEEVEDEETDNENDDVDSDSEEEEEVQEQDEPESKKGADGLYEITCKDCGCKFKEEFDCHVRCDECYEKWLLPLRDNYKGFTEKNLKDAPAQVILELLHMCHPTERIPGHANNAIRTPDDTVEYVRRTEAYDIGRGAILSEITARGEAFMHDLGMSTKMDAVYVDWPGDEHYYSDMINPDQYGRRDDVWSIVERYEPIERIGWGHTRKVRRTKEAYDEAVAGSNDKKSGMQSYYKGRLKRVKEEYEKAVMEHQNRLAELAKNPNATFNPKKRRDE